MTQAINSTPVSGSILVVGGGISGLTAAIEAAEVGYEVFLVEKEASLGGRVSQLNKYFPKLCPPSCGLEINYRRIKDNPNIKVFTLAEVDSVDGRPGDYSVTVTVKPKYVSERASVRFREAAQALETELPNDFNFGMDTRKGLYMTSEMAFPSQYLVDPDIIGTSDANKIKEICGDAVNFDEEPKSFTLKVGAVVWATGWKPYDAARIDNLGFGRYENIITNMMLERMASSNGPTAGKIQRPSDSRTPESIAFVQCAGSRDENHLPYCSYICCMASLKHATYIREQYPEAKIYIYYIDLRTPGYRYERFYNKLKDDKNVFFIKGKVAEVDEDVNGNVKVLAEDAVTGEKKWNTVDMAVLATGMQPAFPDNMPKADVKLDENGFIINDFVKGGMFACGCANKPADVVSCTQNATGIALKAIQTLVRR